MTTSIEEALRSGAWRLVPVEATQDMSAAGEVALVDVLHSVDYFMPDDGMRRVLSAAISASPDHTPALVALIEERDRLKVERDFWENRENEALKRALAAESEVARLKARIADLEERHYAD